MNTKIIPSLLKYKTIYLVLLLLIVLILPYALRLNSSNPTLIGTSSYYHLAQAEKAVKPYQNPYHFLLSLNITKKPLGYFFIQLALAVVTVLTLIKVTNKIFTNEENQFFFLVFLIISPAFIYTFTVFNHYSFFIFLNVLGFAFLLNSNKKIKYCSLFFFILVPFLDLASSFFTFLLLGYYHYYNREKTGKIIIAGLFFSTVLNQILAKPLFLGPYAWEYLPLDFFSDLGGLFGISLFTLILAVIGISHWGKKEKAIYLFLPLLLLTLLRTPFLIYFNWGIVLLASLGFVYLLNKEGKLETIKKITLFLIVLGLLFSTVSSLNKLSVQLPDQQTEKSTLYLKETVPFNQTIFSHPQDSYFIEYYAQKPAYVHYHDSDFKIKNNVTSHILQSSYIEKTFPLLEINNLFYIYLSKKTKQDLPKEEGLIFLFKNERFKIIYEDGGTEIWRFKKG